MATNEVFKQADAVSLPVPSGVKSGEPVLIGSLPAVALTTRGEGGNASDSASVRFTGAWTFDVDGAVAVGAPVYITSARALTATATGNTLYGYGLAAKGTGAGVIPVRIAQV